MDAAAKRPDGGIFLGLKTILLSESVMASGESGSNGAYELSV